MEAPPSRTSPALGLAPPPADAPLVPAASAPARVLTLRARRWGNALAVVLPEEVARDLGLVEGSLVDARLRKRRG